jgi:hypothetical protein
MRKKWTMTPARKAWYESRRKRQGSAFAEAYRKARAKGEKKPMARVYGQEALALINPGRAARMYGKVYKHTLTKVVKRQGGGEWHPRFKKIRKSLVSMATKQFVGDVLGKQRQSGLMFGYDKRTGGLRRMH